MKVLAIERELSAVLILECKDKPAATELISNLSLVRHKIIGFNLTEPRLYTGFVGILQ